jgi:small-conductance mechanosensitive channel
MIFWVRDYTEPGLAQSEVHEEIERRFHDAGVALPSPIHRMVLEGGTTTPRRGQEV